MNDNTKRVYGKSASPGAATGRPVIVRSEDDLHLVGEGDILVAMQTDIAYVPAMQRAGAIVTETGGRFCHAAVWARENAKPTLIQVQGATTCLAPAPAVLVDASGGFIEWEES